MPPRPVALVTGGNRGIGRGIAFALAESGFDVVIADLVATGDTSETEAGIAARGARCLFVAADIGDLHAHAPLLDATWEVGGRLDCLVNNAGVSVASRGDLLDVSVASFDRVLGINLRGTFFLTQAAVRRMLADAPSGHPRTIVTISSSNAVIASPERAEYCIAKAGLAMMTRLYALRLAAAGIGVYEIRPGIIRTDMTKPAAARYDKLIAEGLTPIARWGEAADVGRAAAMLARGDLPFVTGEAIHVDGGLHIQKY
jgi:NAD(P)-dependent dehydrogenase (short-subunit alcohol dehydrogenase family)